MFGGEVDCLLVSAWAGLCGDPILEASSPDEYPCESCCKCGEWRNLEGVICLLDVR